MGLFSKDSPADKKLKKLTGGFILSNSFIGRLKRNNLDISDGTKIREQLKKEIKEGSVHEFNIETRLSQLIDQYSGKEVKSKEQVLKKKCPKCLKSQDVNNNACIYCGHMFNSSQTSKTCPKCGKSQEEDNQFCINCRHEFTVEKPEKKCPKCGESQEEDNQFCISCGYEFTAEKPKKKCPICDEIQDADHNVCISCGYDFVNRRVKPKYKNCPNCDMRLFETTMICANCGYDFERKIMPNETVTCPNCSMITKKSSRYCPKCGYNFSADQMPQILDEIRRYTFLANYDFNLKTCPDCNTQFLKTDPFCFNCGTSVLTSQTIKNDNLEVRDGKLVAKTESSQNELSELETLYSQTVKSKYAPSFKVAYVLYLEEFRKNPSKKFSDKLAKKYDTTVNKLKNQSLEDGFIELAPPLLAAKDSKVSDLKDILREHNLKVSGKKDELIERLGENLSDDELKKYFKSKTYQISNDGLDFLAKNSYILYIYSDADISKVFYPSEIAKIFEEKQYSLPEIQDIILRYLKRIFDEKLTQELWVDFKIYANAIAKVLEDKSELKEALNIRFKVFMFDINNFSIVLGKPDPRKTKLKQKDISKLMELMHNVGLSIDELKDLFSKSYNEVLFKVVITKEDSLIYLLKIFGGEDLDKVSLEINERYSNPY